MAKEPGETGTTDRLGATPGKLALIAALAATLLVVLYMQLGTADATEPAAATGNRDRDRPSGKPRSAVAKGGKTAEPFVGATWPASDSAGREVSFNERLWSAPELSAVVAYDPFALPAAFPQPAQLVVGAIDEAADGRSAEEQLTAIVAEIQSQLEELRQRGVHVIVKQGDGYVAMIDDRILRVGDEINGFTVTSIEPSSGVKVVRKVVE